MWFLPKLCETLIYFPGPPPPVFIPNKLWGCKFSVFLLKTTTIDLSIKFPVVCPLDWTSVWSLIEIFEKHFLWTLSWSWHRASTTFPVGRWDPFDNYFESDKDNHEWRDPTVDAAARIEWKWEAGHERAEESLQEEVHLNAAREASHRPQRSLQVRGDHHCLCSGDISQQTRTGKT